ncbi:MAG TPA: dinitrogenase iron-molybdenum cofactor [Desulfotomaculum sp.]|jgi:predicted Fe-Mo cluster-binding NifX family protein|nr:dinitrogenase iron-molybdenum cofactor [Desulfotomaculum sp.]
MKIAVATEGAMVAEHFGHCTEYTIAEIENGELAGKVVIPNPGHQPGFLPRYLAGLGANWVVAGGMGARAQSLFNEAGIRTMVGVTGLVNRAIDDFIANRLVSGDSLCDHEKGGHDEEGRCGYEGCHE